MSDQIPSDEDIFIPSTNFTGENAYDDLKLKKDTVLCLAPVPPIHGFKKPPYDAGLYWATIFGLRGFNPQKPDKPPFRPLVSHSQRGGQGRDAIDDPMEDLIAEQQARLEGLIAGFTADVAEQAEAQKKKGKIITPDQIKKAIDDKKKKSEECGALMQWLKDFNVSRKVRMYVLQKNGRYGIFQLSWTLFKAYKKEAEKAREKFLRSGIDQKKIGAYTPFVNFIRVGDGWGENRDRVELATVQKPGTMSEEMDYHVWTATQWKEAESILPAMEKIRDRQLFTIEQHRELADHIRENGYVADPKEVDRILKMEERFAARKSDGGSSDDPFGVDSKAPPASVGASDDDVTFGEDTSPAGDPKVDTKTAKKTEIVVPPTTPAAEDDDVEDLFK